MQQLSCEEEHNHNLHDWRSEHWVLMCAYRSRRISIRVNQSLYYSSSLPVCLSSCLHVTFPSGVVGSQQLISKRELSKHGTPGYVLQLLTTPHLLSKMYFFIYFQNTAQQRASKLSTWILKRDTHLKTTLKYRFRNHWYLCMH